MRVLLRRSVPLVGFADAAGDKEPRGTNVVQNVRHDPAGARLDGRMDGLNGGNVKS